MNNEPEFSDDDWSLDTKQETSHHLDGFMQERRNTIANALELRLSCTNPLIILESH